jgi:predicted metalloprotease with PDZ domain
MNTNFSRSAIAAACLLLASGAGAQDAPIEPGRDLVDLFEKMHREGIDEQEIRRMLDRGIDLEPRPTGEAQRPGGRWFIGLMVEPLPPFLREHLALDADSGVRVSRVLPESPAAKAGIQPNDIVTTANGRKVGSLPDLKQAVDAAGKDAKPLKIEWLHRGQPKSAEIQPQDLAPPAPEPPVATPLESIQRQLDRQQREIDALRKELRRLRARLGERSDRE